MVETKDILNIILIGLGSSFLLFFVIFTLFARILTFTVIGNLDDIVVLYIIIFSMLILTLILSVLVGILVGKQKDQNIILISSILAFAANLILITVLSYTFVWIFIPTFFNEFNFLDYFINYPTILVYFSIFVLNHPINLTILSILTYFIFLSLFLSQLSGKYENKN